MLALNLYYAVPGQEDAIRRRGLLVAQSRARLGMRPGNVLWLTQGTPELPCMIWACPFVYANDFEVDAAVRQADAEFGADGEGGVVLYQKRVYVPYELEDGTLEAMLAPVVWQAWWSVPYALEKTLLDTLKETAAGNAGGTRNDAILRRLDYNNDVPRVICAAAFPNLKRALDAMGEPENGPADAPRSPMAPVYSLWERIA